MYLNWGIKMNKKLMVCDSNFNRKKIKYTKHNAIHKPNTHQYRKYVIDLYVSQDREVAFM